MSPALPLLQDEVFLEESKADKLRLPIFTSQLPHEGWKTPFRRFGQYWLYHWYHMRDERN